MKTLFKYIAVVILATMILICCVALMLFASVIESVILIALCVTGAVLGAVVISYLVAEVE